MAVSRLAMYVAVYFFAAMTTVLSAPLFAETIVVGGVGSLTGLAKLLGAEYAKKNPGFEISVIEPPIGTKGAIRALAAGKIDLALSGRPLNADEAGLGKPWLQTPLVLATLGGKSQGLSRRQIADIYAGRQGQWDDNKPIRLVLRGDQETETKVLRALSPEVDAAVTEALKRPGLPIAENDLDALEILARIPGSLGTTALGLLKVSGSRLTALPIDGVAPSAKALEDGRYPWRRQFFLITSTTTRPSVAAFVAWLNSAPAQTIAARLDYVPIIP
jgi:phosphate transport system substrate-binding protein